MTITENANHDPGLDAIEAQSQQLRAGLADTVGELKSRLSPETIKADVKDQVTRTGQDMLARFERSARENPLQTAAIGAGLAYPVISILRSIPAPILLMGAGVALSGRGNLLSGLLPTDKMSDAVAAGGNRAGALADSASAQASAAAGTASSTLRQARDGVSDATTAVTTSVSETVSDARQAAADTAHAASHMAMTNYHDGAEALRKTASRAAEQGRQGRDALVDAVQRNPLLVGALTALAGAALAAMIPSSRTESRMFGETSDRLKDQAKATASEGAHAVIDAGERVAASTRDAARDQGLDAEAGRDAIRDVAGRAGAVLDAGVNAVVAGDSPAAPAAPRPANF